MQAMKSVSTAKAPARPSVAYAAAPGEADAAEQNQAGAAEPGADEQGPHPGHHRQLGPFGLAAATGFAGGSLPQRARP